MSTIIAPGREYEQKMREEGCRFCQERWREKAIAASGGWIAVHNEYPRLDALFIQPVYQIVLCPIDHIVDEIDENGFIAIGRLRSQLREQLDLTGYGICIREGDRLLSGKTVPHIHAHLVVPQTVTLADGSRRASTFNFPVGDRDAPVK